jgi:plasmid maintenance system antidote protein VapI
VVELRRQAAAGASPAAIGRAYGISWNAAKNIVAGRSWKGGQPGPAEMRDKDADLGFYAALEGASCHRGGPLTFGALVRSIRETDEHTLEDLAKRLGVSRAHLCDIEKGRRAVSAERAARWARTLGYAEALFVKLAMQAELDAAGIKLKIDVKAA